MQASDMEQGACPVQAAVASLILEEMTHRELSGQDALPISYFNVAYLHK
jgi:hypothetical protein